MQIYLINLARRPDRLAAMTQSAAHLGLVLRRVDALDARVAGSLGEQFDDDGPLGEIPRGDQCCTISHTMAWRDFVASSEDYAAVLEDDVALTPGAARFLKDANWVPPGQDLIKLEHYGPPGQSVLLSDLSDLGHGFRMGRMHSRHTGAAAYILSRRAAIRLLEVKRFSLPVDHLLFNPNNSPVFRDLAPWQLLPAVARQKDFIGEKSDIEGWRRSLRQFTPSYARRELIRFGYDLKLIPRQFTLLATGRAKFIRIGTE